MPQQERIFLSAEWRDLLMLNYEVDRGLLEGHVPPGTILDSFAGKTYVSLVGFRFCSTKLRGLFPIPFHSNFDEVNLRFYVRRKDGDEVHRGVVFIAEIVPKRAVALVARLAFGENYVRFPMRHNVKMNGEAKSVEYQWQRTGTWCKLYARSSTLPTPATEGSLEQFITEHYWGYSKQQKGGSLEYHVAHAPWKVWTTSDAGFEGDAGSLYGAGLGKILQGPPSSAFIADGSPVKVFAGNKIR